MSKGKKELIQLLATEHHLSLGEVKKIVSSQFALVVETIQEGKFDAVRLPLFGVFRAKPSRIKYINDVKRKAAGTGRRPWRKTK